MGYYETYCQLCGVSFAIARHRRADEPPSAAWDYTGSTYASFIIGHLFAETCGDATGSDCEILEGEADGYQHIAGPGCASHDGYNGHRISMEEMEGCRAVQALVKKEKGWEPDDDDQDFEIETEYFLTGVGDGSPDYTPLEDIKPARHGISRTSIANVRWFLIFHLRLSSNITRNQRSTQEIETTRIFLSIQHASEYSKRSPCSTLATSMCKVFGNGVRLVPYVS